MGMSLSDFCSCTPSEFKKIYEIWYAREERQVHREWEMTRDIIVTYAQTHSTKVLDKQKIMPFPWDKKGLKSKESPPSTEARMKKVLDRLQKETNDGQ